MPKPYVRPIPATWWLKNRAYFWFMMRELTAVFVAVYCVLLLYMLWEIKTSSNPGIAYEDILTCLQTSKWSLIFHFFAFVAAMYHTFTWFSLVPKVMVVRLGEEKVPPIVLVLAHWLLWLIITAGLLWFVFRPIKPAANATGPAPVPAESSTQPPE
jgi:fumarate reductase subunit C